MEINVLNESDMKQLGYKLGQLLQGGEVIELIGDVGAGKTTFTKGLALGMGVDENVQSPSFTINANYQAKGGLGLSHYDFYRLQDAGIMTDALAETVGDGSTVTVVEWAGLVGGVLPNDRLVIKITTTSEDARHLEIIGSNKTKHIIEGLEK